MLYQPKSVLLEARRIAGLLRVAMSRVLPSLIKPPGAIRPGGSIVSHSGGHPGPNEASTLLEAIVNSSSDAIVGKTCEGIITSWNPGAERIFGYTAQEVIGRSAQILFPAGRIDEELDILARIVRGERVPQFNTIRLRKDGTPLNVAVTVSPVSDCHGTVIGASKIAHDITPSKEAEAALQAGEERFRAYVEQAADALFVHDLTGRFLDVNQRACASLGYSREELLGMSVFDIDTEYDAARAQSAWETILPGQPFTLLGRHRRKDGTTFPVEVQFGCFHLQDTRRYLGMVRDITERSRAEAELRESEERFRAMVDSIPQLAWTARADGFRCWFNQRWYDFTGTTPEQMESRGWQSVHDPEMLPRVMVQWTAAIAAGEPFEMEFPLRGADGRFRQFLTRAVPVKNASGQVVEWVGTNTDVDELKRVQDNLRKNKARLSELNADLNKTVAENALIADALYNEKERAQVTLNSIGDAVICTDTEGRVSYLNGAAERLTQWTITDSIGRRLEEVFHLVEAESREVIQNPMLFAVDAKSFMALLPSCILIRRDRTELSIEGSCAPIHDRDGNITGAVMVFRDVSVARSLSRQLAYQAAHDSLTDLPNRNLLRDRLGQAVASLPRHHTSLAVLYLDVDRFKHINDSLGHAIGDRLLQSIALRLTACVRTSDTVSRQGGDEFVIMLVDINGARDAAIGAEKLLHSLRLPYVLDAHELHVSASIGIAICPQDGTEADALLRNADSAMYEAKQQGRNNYQFYRKALNESALARQSLEGDLRHAITRQQLELQYQPIMDVRSGHVAGVETLLRWHHPTQGLLLPADFMPIAEDSGLIVPIGQWVLRTTCAQARDWQLEGMARMRYAVNVSPVELRAKEFVAGVATVINETSIEPSILELEVTETYLMQDSKSTALVLKSLKDLHVNLALDDFGTGYSSLSYIRRFPIDTLKIDRSFVKDLTTDAADASLVSAVINMGKSLHMQVVAEGVETREQLSFLEMQDCHEAQGYFFSPPVAAKAFAPLVHRIGALHQS